ncbi:MAG: hypothetical protein ACRDT0_19495 [Pseudonocardiaceae bacterium]
MSAVWQAQYRLLGERLRERLAGQADRGLASDRDDELLLRLLGLVVDLHEWHHVDRYGQCRRCRLKRHRWQHRRPKRCPVVESIEYYFDEELHFIWWQVFGQLGREMTLEDTEEWVERQRQELSGDELDNDESDDPAATVAMEAVERDGGRHEWR